MLTTCPTCGGSLDMNEDFSRIFCENCHAEYDPRTSQLLAAPDATGDDIVKNAEILVSLGDFDRAERIYEQMVDTYADDWRGWWGLILSKTHDLDPSMKVSLNEIHRLFGYVQKLATPEEFKSLSQKYAEYGRTLMKKVSTDFNDKFSPLVEKNNQHIRDYQATIEGMRTRWNQVSAEVRKLPDLQGGVAFYDARKQYLKKQDVAASRVGLLSSMGMGAFLFVIALLAKPGIVGWLFIIIMIPVSAMLANIVGSKVGRTRYLNNAPIDTRYPDSDEDEWRKRVDKIERLYEMYKRYPDSFTDGSEYLNDCIASLERDNKVFLDFLKLTKTYESSMSVEQFVNDFPEQHASAVSSLQKGNHLNDEIIFICGCCGKPDPRNRQERTDRSSAIIVWSCDNCGYTMDIQKFQLGGLVFSYDASAAWLALRDIDNLK